MKKRLTLRKRVGLFLQFREKKRVVSREFMSASEDADFENIEDNEE